MFAVFAVTKSSEITCKEICWTTIYVQPNLQFMKIDKHKNCGLPKC
jgi:hypothetical protein